MTHDNKAPGEQPSEPGQPKANTQPHVQPKPFVYPDTPDDTGDVSAEVAALKAELAEAKDRVLRTHAEMDNMRKRLEKEKADASKYAISKFARDIVNVGDNFQRAIATVAPEAAEADSVLKSFLDGVTLTEREFISVLERHGVKRVDPRGPPFNPHQHQAVMEQPNPDVASGTVLQVFQLGYMIEDRVLRPAMVVVSTGGAKPAKPAENGPPPIPPANDPGSSAGNAN